MHQYAGQTTEARRVRIMAKSKCHRNSLRIPLSKHPSLDRDHLIFSWTCGRLDKLMNDFLDFENARVPLGWIQRRSTGTLTMDGAKFESAFLFFFFYKSLTEPQKWRDGRKGSGWSEVELQLTLHHHQCCLEPLMMIAVVAADVGKADDLDLAEADGVGQRRRLQLRLLREFRICAAGRVPSDGVGRIRHRQPSNTSQSRLRIERSICAARDWCGWHSAYACDSFRKETNKTDLDKWFRFSSQIFSSRTREKILISTQDCIVAKSSKVYFDFLKNIL